MTAGRPGPDAGAQGEEAGQASRAGRMLGAAACVALGLFAAREGYRLGLFAFGAAEPGLFPFLFGALLAALALAALCRDVLRAAPAMVPAAAEARGAGTRHPIVYLATLGAFTLLLDPLGFLAAAALALFALMAGAERMAWRRAAMIALLAAAACWLLFVWFLSVPLPAGRWLPA